MKKRSIIYVVLAVVGVGIILYFLQPSLIPGYCGLYSGSFSGLASEKSNKCVKAGCKVNIIKVVNDNPEIMDDGTVIFKCER